MGLRMQFATNRNDRIMIARHSQVFVSIRGRSRQIRHKLYDCLGELLKSEALQMVTNACEFLTNPCEFLTKLTIT